MLAQSTLLQGVFDGTIVLHAVGELPSVATHVVWRIAIRGATKSAVGVLFLT